MEAKILQQGYLAVGQAVRHFGGLGANDLLGAQQNVPAQQLAQPLGRRLEGEIFLEPLTGRPTKMAHQDQPAALGQDVLDRRQGHDDPPVVADLALLDRDVEIDPHQNLLARNIDVRHGLRRHLRFPLRGIWISSCPGPSL